MLLDCLPRRARRRSTKCAQFKYVQRLLQRRDELSDIERRSVVQVALDEPVFMGWERYFVVRSDVARSDEGPYLEYILKHIQCVEPCGRDGVLKERDWRRGNKLRVVEHRLANVDPGVYWAMTPRMRRYFEPHVTRTRNPFTCRQDAHTTFVLCATWKFKTKVRKRWKTHETVYTVNVDAEEAHIDRHLYGPSEWAYRHWARHVGDSFRYDYGDEIAASDRRRAPLIELAS